jgi:hypothetical protein
MEMGVMQATLLAGLLHGRLKVTELPVDGYARKGRGQGCWKVSYILPASSRARTLYLI